MNIKPKAMCGEIPVYCSHDEIVDVMKVIPNPKNPNEHEERQIEILAKVIKAQGWRKPITVSKRSGFVVSGHGRLQAALLLGADMVPIDYQEYATEADEWADLVADNRIAELSSINEDLLIDILNEINDTDIDVLLTGYEYHEIDDLLNDEEHMQIMESFTASTVPSFGDTPSEQSSQSPSDYEESLERKRENTGEIDVDDYAEDKYRNQCPKCKFMW